MSKQRIAVTIDDQHLNEIDELVAKGRYPSRSQVVEAALAAVLSRCVQSSLIRECARFDSTEERSFAEGGLRSDGIGWPAY